VDPEPLVNEQIEAGARFLREFDRYAPIQVAFWLRENDRRLWHLYIASEEITDENFDLAYGEVARLSDVVPPDPNFDPLRIKVLGAHEPLAKAAVVARSYYPVPVPVRLRDTYFGGLSVAEAYIYPLPIPAQPSPVEPGATR
jgi:hypothetical protein